ncbi:MAG: amino acid adenylation domain-containing protein [Okeania sp. SIO2C9]|uniref:amino acid adenylation domain-containing protein n=1 Tax=Okeania sp. SIO2C9 TaxID=2607791 RepID=UPI0013C187FC|nr:non-ribosomal peptide synthetase [Okeania sp. SIO2C9]NEQ77288.1 amino acid adenylation domain-containing protein [Okeania sp. SIO2C9]
MLTKKTNDLIYNPEKSSVYPMSQGQKWLWFIHKIAPDHTAYNEYNAVKINSPLDIETWKATWQKIVERHGILRTTYGTNKEGEPVQIVHRTMNVPMQVIDAKDWSEERLKQEILACADVLYDLEKDPIIRLYLFQRSATEWVQMFTIHQIASDSFSKDLFFKEFQQLYAGIPVQEPLAYTDFVNWESQMLNSPRGETLCQYWEKQLAGELQILDLPRDLPRSSVVNYRQDFHELKLHEELVSCLKKLESDSINLLKIALSAFYVLLYRYTNQEDIIVNIPTENRLDKKEFKDVAGNLASLVIVRGNLEGNTTFKDLLMQVAQTVDEALKHEAYNYPWSQLVKELKLKSNFRHGLVSSVMFNWRKLGWYETEFQEGLLQIEPYLLGEQRGTLYDIFVEFLEVGNELNVRWNYNGDLFKSETIERMARHYLTLLEGIVANPETPIFKLPLLSESERHQLLIEWNNTTVDYPQDKCIHQLFSEQVEKTPDAVAVVFEGEELTYRELNSRANQLARYLQKLGVKPESLVGICVERSLEMMVGLLGIMKAGGAYVPLDPVYPQERVHYILSNSQAKFLITSSQLLSSLPNSETQVICLDTERDVISLESPENPESKVKPDNLSYVIFTSGSTGKPKGVEICHQSLVNFINSMGDKPGLKNSDRLLALTTICFDIHTTEIYLPLTIGATIILISRKVAQEPLRLASKIAQYDATVMQATPATWQMLLVANWSGRPDLKAICGGEALPKELANNLLEKVGSLWNMYGPTETTVWSTIYEVTPNRRTFGEGTPELIGRPIANTQIYILDKHLQPVPIGVPGELHIGGAGLARGYLNRPELTEQKFIPNPFEKSKLYKTGDLVRYLPDGNIEFLGRIDNQVKIRGFRIELGEIEALLAQHSNVREVVVIAREDIPGDKRLVAYLITNNAKTTINDLRFFLKTKLPEYMIPAAFVFLEAIPLTPNGKVNRRCLPVPDTSNLLPKTSFVAPRNSVELQLAHIWSEILGVSPVGIHNNFIELGGDSLLATKIIGLVRDRFGVELPLNRLFEYPTVAELAKIVTQVAQEERSNPLPSLEPISREQTIPLSFGQEQLWFLTQLAPSEPVYNETFTIHLGGDINIQALSDSLTELICRHEILRTTFRVVNGQPVQEIHPPSALTLPVVDLRFLPETERETEALRIATEELRAPFDLTRGPLLRATLIQLAETDYRLYLAMHHTLIDGESLTSIVLPELETLYTAFSRGLPSPLPELTIQYADFAVWQRQWLQGEILSDQLAYWEKKLENLPQLQLPTDHHHTPQTTFAGSRLCFALSKDLTEKIKTISRQEGVTLFMTLATAINILLYRYSSQEDIVIGTVTSQRNRPELQGIMGDFLNTLVLRSDLSGNPSFRDLLKRVRNVILSAYANQDVPFEQVVNALHPDRHVSQNPLFQVMFVLQPPLTDEQLGWTVSQLEVDSGCSKFDLTFNLEEQPEGMTGAIEYNTDLFDATSIDRAIGHLMTLLEGIVTNPNQSISELPLLTEQERYQLLVEWNDTAVDYPQDKCVHQLFEEQVEKTPDAVAVVFEEQELTYRELNCRANQLAHYLQTLGVQPEVLVGICVERSLEMMVGLLGILKAGGAYVPIDPNYPTERIAYMLEDSAVSVLLTSKSVWLGLPEHSARVVCLDSDWDTIVNYSIKNIDSGVTPENLAYVIYTSGSTGKPKGTMIINTGVVNYLSWCIQVCQLTQGNGVPVNSSIGFDLTITSLFSPLLKGQKVILLPEQDEIEALSQLLCSQKNLSLVKITPAHLQILNTLIPPEKASNQTRAFIIAGEALPVKTVSFWSNNAPETKLINEYGPTETVVGCCVYQVKPEESDREIVPIGRPIANTQIYILDSNNQPVPIGVPGELHIGGAGLARGYLNRRELTEKKFIPNPFNNSKVRIQKSKLYKTGDLARYLPDGNIEFLGRIDHQVKIRGFRIELGEIEAVLAQHSLVREAVVIAREDISGYKRLVAYLTTNDPKTAVDNLRSFLKTKLPEYMIPAAFVFLEAIPLTPNGKVNRRGLPISDPSSLLRETSFVAPRDSVELQLAQMWSEILGISPIGVGDNFFDLGGHSLLAVRLMAEIEKQFSKNLSLAALFQGATVEQLAILLRQKTNTHSWSPLVAIQPEGNYPPFFCMPGSGGNVVYFHQLARHLGNDQPFYALQPPSLDGISEPFGSVEEVAAYYLKAIQSLQPSGPYFLGGHSFGVLVAFEMAQQLQQLGETVALLALFDLPALLPGSVSKQLDWDDTQWLTNIAHVLEMLSGKNLNISYETLKPLTSEVQVNYLKQQMETVNLLPYNSGIERVRGIVQTIKTDELAFMSYVPQEGYQGRITLFRSSEVYQDELGMLGEIPTDPTWGWNQFSTQPVEVHVVPGNHTTMLSEPHVQVLAEMLKLCYQQSSPDFQL